MSVNVISGWLELLQDWVSWAIGLGVPAVLVAVILSPWFSRVWPLRRPEPVPTVFPKARACKGLVVIVSPGAGSGSARAAVEYHLAGGLEQVWLVYSDASAGEAEALREELSRKPQLTASRVLPVPFSNSGFQDPEQVRAGIEEGVYGRLPEGMEAGDVILDLTGGPKTASVGAFLAGLPPGRRLEVVRAGTMDSRLRAESPADPFEICLDYKLKRVRRL